ncbi:MAG: hypothetical protein LWX54_11215 [Deltaproteobacteria bacterium]|jgi:hypothetical protein|nr:hypothetical protein [Deltaproteobacteria bacterium]
MTEQWVIAIGTAILAVIALFQDYIRSWIKTPTLEVTTGSCTPFCKKLLFIAKDDSEKKADGYALRIKVKNVNPLFHTKTRAECVEVFALRLLKKRTDGSFQPIQEFEPRNLLWSNSFYPFSDISPEMERYCFIGRLINPKDRHNFPDFDVESYNMNETCLRIDVDIARNTKEHIIPPGTYHIECLIGSANTKAFKKTFEISISGEWFDDEIRMYEKGLRIEMA